ncbi:MAG: hypothetical protein JSV50_02440 [Desulfobacteraceae bacterium]|nr:MAG: hypothetical protein JSV50_02440 [Desulfobacteraceae bacterium]
MEEYVLRILEADNPWLSRKNFNEWYKTFLPKKFIPRNTVLDPDHRVCLVVGPRQV